VSAVRSCPGPDDEDPKEASEYLKLIYQELRRLAAHMLSKEKPGQTLQATALVHEAWLRLGGGENRAFNDREHFFRAAAQAMRRILVDNARRKKAMRNGGELRRTQFDTLGLSAGAPDDELLEVHEALDALAAHDERKAELVKLRYFVGLTIEEAAKVLAISEPTAKRDWAYARAWLFRRINETKI